MTIKRDREPVIIASIPGRLSVTCECQCGCGETFSATPARLRAGGGKFVDREHQWNALRKYPQTDNVCKLEGCGEIPEQHNGAKQNKFCSLDHYYKYRKAHPPRHGTVSRYRGAGKYRKPCRCNVCKKANSKYLRDGRQPIQLPCANPKCTETRMVSIYPTQVDRHVRRSPYCRKCCQKMSWRYNREKRLVGLKAALTSRGLHEQAENLH